MHILIVKTSSLGDIIHTLPALTDAARALPALRCDWLAERTYQEIPGWHRSVARSIACDLRGWRRAPLHTAFGGGWAAFRHELRAVRYDCVVDAQGLLKSAVLAWQARGPLAGPGFGGAREPLAALFYRRRCAVPRHDAAHAVERMRRLFALALGYALPQSPPDAGLEPQRFPAPPLQQPYVVLLHGTTWASKRWPQANWMRLAQWLAARGLRAVLPWGDAAEHTQAEAIAGGADGLVLPRLGLTELAGWLAHARACVGVDTGLSHLAAALGTPQVSLYGPTVPELTGAVGARQVWLRSEPSMRIDRARANTVAPERVEEALGGMLEQGSRA